MSGGPPARFAARSFERGRQLIREQNEDCRRGEFLRAIDASIENLSDFEMNFIESFLGDRALKDAGLDFQWFTPKRRTVVDGMIKRYGMRSLRPAPTRKPPQAEPGHCGYLIERDGRRNQLCDEPAVIKLNNSLELCAEHDAIRQQEIEKLRRFKTRNMR